MKASPISRYITEFRLTKADDENIVQQIQAQTARHEAPVEDKIEMARLIEEKIRREVRASADQELKNALAAEHTRYEERLVEMRKVWVQEQAELLSSQWLRAVEDLENRLVERVGRILVPFLSEALQEQAMRELRGALSVLLASSDHKAVKVSGPQDLMTGLEAHLGPLAASVEFAIEEQPDVRVVSNDTVIETQLKAWRTRLSEAVRAD